MASAPSTGKASEHGRLQHRSDFRAEAQLSVCAADALVVILIPVTSCEVVQRAGIIDKRKSFFMFIRIELYLPGVSPSVAAKALRLLLVIVQISVDLILWMIGVSMHSRRKPGITL